MLRDVDMNEISDGREYSGNDMVKAGCNDCRGCCDCCCHMGESIILDPYDVYQLKTHLSLSFDALIRNQLEMHVVEGIVLPNIKMQGINERCCFLNELGRCSIHQFRPGFCRLFPLGRIYDEGKMNYFLLINECTKANRTKVKVKQWIGVDNFVAYENFVLKWHFFLRKITEHFEDLCDDQQEREINLALLQYFYASDFSEDFYNEMEVRMRLFDKFANIH